MLPSVVLPYVPETGARILGPLTHAKTVSLAVSSSNSNLIAVTGWPSVATNLGTEQVKGRSMAGGKCWGQHATEGCGG